MTYQYKCETCGGVKDVQRPVAMRNDPVWCHGRMIRTVNAPHLITQPYHLKEGNRFKGDLSDYKAYRNKYDKMHETHTEKMQEFSTVQAQIYGAEVYKPQKSKSLIEMAKEAGLRG